MVDEEEREDHVRTPEVSPNKDAGPMKLEKVIRGPGALPSLASPSAIVRNNRSESKSPSTVISRSSSFQDNPLNENDYPPMPRPKIGERHQPCAICTMPIDLSTLTESAWKTHIDQDIDPYVCISEDCIEPLQYFTSLQSWMDHMLRRHSINWSEQIHTRNGIATLITTKTRWNLKQKQSI
ncbi:uncharacterized protein TrAFT101_011503 [Trichoderma asperellum]|uniref:uncharacterized protein n=1 Tax=Trichoderma asperellum TaxID=101201 RepID=UPI0033342659|nr:hypothetical protein TrAFT101_011503 [Trichoderma asperellum]